MTAKKVTEARAPEGYNRGQAKEYAYRLQETGKALRADNRPHTEGGDLGDLQIKAARATVCKGLDLDSYLDADGAKAWVYIANDWTAYTMDRTEWTAFVRAFGTVTYDSKKNGGGAKIRLKSEGREMTEWLRARA